MYGKRGFFFAFKLLPDGSIFLFLIYFSRKAMFQYLLVGGTFLLLPRLYRKVLCVLASRSLLNILCHRG